MEVIIIEQNRSDRFLMRYFLEEMDSVTKIQESHHISEVIAYLTGKNDASSASRIILMFGENIGIGRGASFLSMIAKKFPALDTYRVLLGETTYNSRLAQIHPEIHDYMEKKMELDDFGREINQVILRAQRRAAAPVMASIFPTISSESPRHHQNRERKKSSKKQLFPTCVFRLFSGGASYQRR